MRFLTFTLFFVLFAVSALAQITATLQSNTTNNLPGSPLTVTGSATATLTVNCSSCAGGTTINFEATQDGRTWVPIVGLISGSYPPTYANLTTASGLSVWSFGVSGFQQIRARVSSYSAGAVTVTGTAVALTMRSPFFSGVTVANAQLTGAVNDLTTTWQSYTNQITRVACPAAGCAVIIPASTASVAATGTVFIFSSVGPGLMTICVGSGSLLYPTSYLGLPGAAICPSGLGYITADYAETDWLEADGSNNYFISPSLQRLAFCTPYVVPANIVPLANANGFGWSASHSVITLNASFSTDCLGPDALTLIEDATSNFHNASFSPSTTVNSGQVWSSSIFCKALSGDRYCNLQVQDSGGTNQINVVANPQSASTTGVGCTVGAGTKFTGLSCSITPYGAGTVKMQITWTYGENDTAIKLFVNLYMPVTGGSYGGNGTSGAVWWGLCLRQSTSC